VSPPTKPEPPPLAAPWVLGLWLVAAFLSAVSGIGGGLFAVPVLHYLVGLPLRLSIGTSLVLVFTLSGVGTVAEALHPSGALNWPVIGLLVVGGLVGAQVGFRCVQRLDVTLIKRLFALVLLASSVRILGVDAAAAAKLAGDVEMVGPLQMALVALIGFGGGFLAPLLGVGGGLLVVPALFLGLPAIDYLEARACSVAMTVVTSAQSAFLYLRSGQVDRANALRMAGLTAVGAALGVFAVHRPGWTEVARFLLAAILLFVAVRFAWDATRGLRERLATSRGDD
jgi:uncharacterized protein